MGLRPGPFLEMFLFALRALFSLGLRPGLSRPPGGVYLTENVFMGHAARAFLPSGQVFAFRRVTFFLRAQKKSNQKKTAPCGALASLATLLELSSPVSISEGRGTLCKTWSASALLSAFNLVSSTRGFQTPECQLHITSCQPTS